MQFEDAVFVECNDYTMSNEFSLREVGYHLEEDISWSQEDTLQTRENVRILEEVLAAQQDRQAADVIATGARNSNNKTDDEESRGRSDSRAVYQDLTDLDVVSTVGRKLRRLQHKIIHTIRTDDLCEDLTLEQLLALNETVTGILSKADVMMPSATVAPAGVLSPDTLSPSGRESPVSMSGPLLLSEMDIATSTSTSSIYQTSFGPGGSGSLWNYGSNLNSSSGVTGRSQTTETGGGRRTSSAAAASNTSSAAGELRQQPLQTASGPRPTSTYIHTGGALAGGEQESQHQHQYQRLRGYPTMVSIVYMLRRGNRIETQTAVGQLVALCNLEGNARIAAIREMRAAGALQTLLSVLVRTVDWPDVELQASRVISMLVTCEDDWQLLHKNAFEILNSLYMVLLKTSARVRASSTANVNTAASLIPEALGNVVNWTTSSSISTASAAGPNNSQDAATAAAVAAANRQRDARAIAAAALVKMSLVLCKEWGKAEAPLGSFGLGSSPIGPPGLGLGSLGSGAGLGTGLGSISISDASLLNRRRSGSGSSSGNMQGAASSFGSSTTNDPSRVLEAMLNIILNICEPHTLPPPSPTLSPQSSMSASGLGSGLGLGLGSFGLGPADSFEGGIGGVGGVGRGLRLRPSGDFASPAAHGSDSFSSALPVLIDPVSVLCSIALSNLAEVPQCRPGLVQGGALRLLRAWFELGSDVMTGIRDILKQSEAKVHAAKHAAAAAAAAGTTKTKTAGSSDAAGGSDGANISSSSSSSSSVHGPQQPHYLATVPHTKDYAQAFELMNNAAAAVMFLVGGSYTKPANGRSANGGFSHSLRPNGGHDYTVGWIDAQVISEGLPAAIVRYIRSAVDDFTVTVIPSVRDDNSSSSSSSSNSSTVVAVDAEDTMQGGRTETGSGTMTGNAAGQLPPSSTKGSNRKSRDSDRERGSERGRERDRDRRVLQILPRAASMHLAQALFQLCSRVQNRSALSAAGVPFTLCCLFVSAAERASQRTEREQRLQRQTTTGGDPMSPPPMSPASAVVRRPSLVSASSAPLIGTKERGAGAQAAHVHVHAVTVHGNGNGGTNRDSVAEHSSLDDDLDSRYGYADDVGELLSRAIAEAPMSPTVGNLHKQLMMEKRQIDSSEHVAAAAGGAASADKQPLSLVGQSQNHSQRSSPRASPIHQLQQQQQQSHTTPRPQVQPQPQPQRRESKGLFGPFDFSSNPNSNQHNPLKAAAVVASSASRAPVPPPTAGSAGGGIPKSVGTAVSAEEMMGTASGLERDASPSPDTERLYLAAISTACLDAITYFLADAVSHQQHMQCTGSQHQHQHSSLLPSIVLSLSNSVQDSRPYMVMTAQSPLTDIVCSRRMVDAIKLIISSLPRGTARMAALRVVSSLTELPESLSLLIQGEVTDALVLISSEADDLRDSRGGGNTTGAARGAGSAAASSIVNYNYHGAVDQSQREKDRWGGGGGVGVSSISGKSLSSSKKGIRSDSFDLAGAFGWAATGGGGGHATAIHVAAAQSSKQVPSNGSGLAKPTVAERAISGGSLGSNNSDSIHSMWLPLIRGNSLGMTPSSGVHSQLQSHAQSQSHAHHHTHSLLSLLGFGNIGSNISAVTGGGFGAGTAPPGDRVHRRGGGGGASSSQSFVAGIDFDDDEDDDHFDHDHDPTWQWASANPHFSAAALAVAEVPAYISLEETMTVCYALANAVQVDPKCAERVLNNGLMAIMLRLAESSNLEVGRQALRCVAAMCPVISSAPNDRIGASKELRSDIYRDALGVLGTALHSPSSLVQHEAVCGIARLAGADDQMKDQVVTGPLKTIISLLLDSSCDRETRLHAENVLKAVGFRGASDLELCQYDVELLTDWFNMKKSLKPQLLARRLLRHWIEDLFNGSGSGYAGSGSGSGSGGPSSSSSSMSYGAAAAASAQTSSASASYDSMVMRASDFATMAYSPSQSSSPSHGFYQGGGASSSGRYGPTSAAGSAGGHHSRHASGGVLQSLPELQRRFSDSFLRYLPFCLGKSSAMNVIREEELEMSDGYSHSHNHYLGSDSFSPTHASSGHGAGAGAASVSPYGGYNGIDIPPDGVLALLDIFYPSRLQQMLLMDSISLVSDSFLSSGGSAASLSLQLEEALIDGLDDEDTIDGTTADADAAFLTGGGYDRWLGYGVGYGFGYANADELLPAQLPTPREVNALLLPQQEYVSFRRCGRIVERMIDEGDAQQPWSLAFRDSRFVGDFHNSLLSILRRCNRIVSVSFASYSGDTPLQDVRMGWLVGNMPSTVRFVSLRGVLSSESIQALCILLKKQNMAFADLTAAAAVSSDSTSAAAHSSSLRRAAQYPGYQSFSLREQQQQQQQQGKDKELETSGAAAAVGQNTTSIDVNSARGDPAESAAASHSTNSSLTQFTALGLMGLAITHTPLSTVDVSYICDLLLGSNICTAAAAAGGGGSGGSGSAYSAKRLNSDLVEATATAASTTVSGKGGRGGGIEAIPKPMTPARPRLSVSGRIGAGPSCRRGLRFLDLSFCRLGGATCADVLKAAASGPLEGLDLSGNFMQRGSSFLDPAIGVLSSASSPRSGPHSTRSAAGSSSSGGVSPATPVQIQGGANSKLWGGQSPTAADNSTPATPLAYKGPVLCKLKHLGLAHNNMASRVFCGILEALTANVTLTSLDVSHNYIHNYPHTKEALRSFLKSNTGLRSLDLSYNRFTNETVKSIHLGLLENDVLLLLPLIGNYGAENSLEMPMIQSKLNDNRKGYRRQVDDYNKQLRDLDERVARVRIERSNREALQLELEQQQQEQEQELLNEDDDGEVVTGVLLDNDDDDNEPPPSSTCLKAQKAASTGSVNSGGPGGRSGAVTIDAMNPTYSNNYHTGAMSSQIVNLSLELPVAVAVVSPKKPSPRQHTATTTATATATATASIPAGVRSRSASRDIITNANANGSSDSASVATKATSAVTSLLSSSDVDAVVGSHPSSQTQGASLPLPQLSLTTESPQQQNVLNVFFSAPLAWRDRSNRLHPLDALDYSSEREALAQVFREVQRDISVCFDFATTDSIRTALSFGCRALHFSGHGHPQCLNFEDGKSGLQLVSVDTLRSLLSAGGLRLDFVFVSACHSRKTGEAFIEAGVPHVVCVKVDAMIQDSSAMAFTRAFYLNLLSGRTVRHSFEIAREALKASPCVPDSVLEGEKFILLPEILDTSSSQGMDSKLTTSLSLVNNVNKINVSVNHDKPIFEGRPVRYWPMSGQIRFGPGPYLPTPSSSAPLSPSSSLTTFFGSDDAAGGRLGSSSSSSGSSSGYFNMGSPNIPSPPPDFEGREVDMYRVITTVLSRRLVSLVGDVGLGKSALAAASCTYMADRAMFEDGIVFLKAQALSTHQGLLEGIRAAIFAGPPKVASRMKAMANRKLLLPPPPMTASDSGRTMMLASADGSSDGGSGTGSGDPISQLEEQVCTALGPLRVLLVLDHIDGLLKDDSDSAADLKYFLSRLFEYCKHVKVLIVSNETLNMRHVSGFGVVENCVSLGPLSLRNSMRLFARLAPPLMTSEQKSLFLGTMVIPGPSGERQMHATVNSRELTSMADCLLGLFGKGHPARIVKLACESTHDSVEVLKAVGARIVSGDLYLGDSSLSSFDGYESMSATATTANATANATTALFQDSTATSTPATATGTVTHIPVLQVPVTLSAFLSGEQLIAGPPLPPPPSFEPRGRGRGSFDFTQHLSPRAAPTPFIDFSSSFPTSPRISSLASSSSSLVSLTAAAFSASAADDVIDFLA